MKDQNNNVKFTKSIGMGNPFINLILYEKS